MLYAYCRSCYIQPIHGSCYMLPVDHVIFNIYILHRSSYVLSVDNVIFNLYIDNVKCFLYIKLKGVKKITVHSFLHNFFIFGSIFMKITQNRVYTIRKT